MCDPVSLGITAATTLAQSYFQNKAAGDVSKANSRATQKFNDDIKERRDLSNVQFQNSIQTAGVDSDKDRMAKAIADRTAQNQPSFNQNVLLPGQNNATGAVKTAIVQAQDRAKDNNADAAAAAAALGAYGDANLGRDIQFGQNANRIATQGGFAQGALNNLQFDKEAAATAGAKNAGIADLVGALGTIGGAGYNYYKPGAGITWDVPGTPAVAKITPAQAAQWPRGVSVGSI